MKPNQKITSPNKKQGKTLTKQIGQGNTPNKPMDSEITFDTTVYRHFTRNLSKHKVLYCMNCPKIINSSINQLPTINFIEEQKSPTNATLHPDDLVVFATGYYICKITLASNYFAFLRNYKTGKFYFTNVISSLLNDGLVPAPDNFIYTVNFTEDEIRNNFIATGEPEYQTRNRNYKIDLLINSEKK